MVKNEQDFNESRFAYEAPIVSVTVFPNADVICTSDQDAGGEYDSGWLTT